MPGGAEIRRIQDAVQKRMAQVEYLQAQLQEYQHQIDLINVDLTSTLTAQETLKHYHEAAAGDEVLLPIGGNAFVKASVAEPDKVILGVGTDIAIEMAASKGVEELEAKAERLKATLSILRGEADQLAQRADALNGEIRTLYGEANAQGLV